MKKDFFSSDSGTSSGNISGLYSITVYLKSANLDLCKSLLYKLKSAFSLSVVLIFFTSCTLFMENADIKNGRFDLSSFNSDKLIQLNGEWTVSHNHENNVSSYKRVPAIIKNKDQAEYAEFSLNILNVSKDSKALKFNRILTSYSVFINDELVYECGKPDINPKKTIPAFSNKILPLKPDDKGIVNLKLKISNYHDARGAGILESPVIGNTDNLHKIKITRTVLESFTMITLLLTGLFFIFIFINYRKEKALFYFGFLLVTLSLRKFYTGERIVLDIFDSIPWNILFRLEISTVYLIGIFSSLYIYNIVRIKNLKIIWIIYTYLSLAGFILNFTLPAPYFINIMILYYIPAVIMIIWGLFLIFLLPKSSAFLNIMFSAGYILFIISMLFNILYSVGMRKTIAYDDILIVSFVIFQSLYLIRLFLKSIAETEKFAKILNKTQSEQSQINIRLDDMIKKRTRQLELKIEENSKLSEELNQLKKLSSLSLVVSGKIDDISSTAESISEILEKSSVSLVECDKLLSIIHELKNFLAPKQSELPPLPLNTALSKTVHSFLRGTDFNYNIDVSDKQFYSKIDELEFNVLIKNILKNAVEASYNKKQIDITFLKEEKNGKIYNIITVEDYGIGIPLEYESKIFDPFFTTKSSSGLGLTTALSIVQKNNGFIEFKSSPGNGSIFKIFLEDYNMTGNVKEEKIIDSETFILVIDDEPEIIQLMKRLIISHGFIPVTADNGKEGIEIYKDFIKNNKKILCVIVDLILQDGFDGKKIMQSLIEVNPSVIGVLSTGSINDPAVKTPEQYGFRKVLKKPYSVTDFNEIISELRKQKY